MGSNSYVLLIFLCSHRFRVWSVQSNALTCNTSYLCYPVRQHSVNSIICQDIKQATNCMCKASIKDTCDFSPRGGAFLIQLSLCMKKNIAKQSACNANTSYEYMFNDS